MASERTSRGWIGYDWFKLIVGILLVVLMFWISPGQTTTTAAVPPTPMAEPTVSVAPTALAVAAAPTATIAIPTHTSVPSVPTETAVPTATAAVIATATTEPTALAVSTPSPAPAATPNPAAVSSTLTISTPAEGQQLPVGPITISGTGLAGTQIEILDGDQVISTLTISDTETWSTTYTPSNPGTALLTVRPKGGESASTPIRVTIGDQVSASCAQLAIGCDAWVTRDGGLALRMRSRPGASQSIVARIPIGTQVKVLDGPSSVNNLTWWRVSTNAGREGWVSGEHLVLQPD